MARVFLIILSFCFATIAVGQNQVRVWDEASPKLKLAQFDSLLVRETELLQTKRLRDIADIDHIQIMRLYNTGHFGNGLKLSDLKMKAFYKVFERAKYMQKITNIYPKWTENRGMGFYFPQLNVELAGTPTRRNIYHLSY